ncbi:MAG TPA: GlpM family protein [Bacteroidota bacterium]|nr:GlpM family protein [Bacteroidota bacterium]
MSDTLYLALKCFIAAGIMAIIHFISKTSNYYLAALALGFPGLSMTAYYFMYLDRGSMSVRNTTYFAIFAVIPFLAFLGLTNLSLKHFHITTALFIGVFGWLLASILLIIAWKSFH